MTHAVLALLAIAGCDWSLHRMQAPDKCIVHGTTTLLPNDSCNLQPPAGIVAMDTPAPPPQITRALLERGHDRFDRMCAACHGLRADGDSPVARAMTLRRPPSLIDARVAAFTDDRILGVSTTGYGLMPEYGSSLAPADRYAVLHYVRALQQRDVALDQLSPSLQAEARRWLR